MTTTWEFNCDGSSSFYHAGNLYLCVMEKSENKYTVFSTFYLAEMEEGIELIYNREVNLPLEEAKALLVKETNLALDDLIGRLQQAKTIINE